MPKGGFWTLNNGFEPKMQHRFRVYIDGMAYEDIEGSGNCDDKPDETLVWYAKSIDKPTIRLQDINKGNVSLNGPRAALVIPNDIPEFNQIQMTLIDPSYPNATRKLLRLFRRAGYNDEACAGMSFNIPKFRESIGDVWFQQLDYTGQPLETWKLIEAFPMEVNFGKLDYSSDDLVEISISWAFSTFKAFMHGQPGLDSGQMWPSADDPRVRLMPERSFEYFRSAEVNPTLLVVSSEAQATAAKKKFPLATVNVVAEPGKPTE
jgi:hypothetical protein